MYRLTAIAILLFSQFVLAQNTVDQVVVFPDKTYRGSFKSVNQATETVSITSDAIKNDFIIKIKNADGQNHENVVCTGRLFQKLSCGLKNLANLLYRELFRVEYAEITWNGKKVVDANALNRNVAAVSVSVKPESTFTNQKSVAVEIQDVSNVTSTVSINGAVTKSSTAKSFSFDLVNGNNNIEIKSQDQFNNTASPILISNVVLDQSNPNVSLSSNAPIYVNSLPKTLAVQLISNEPLKSLLVNSNQVSLDESGKIGVYNLSILQSGANSVAVQATDLAGNVSNQNLSLSVILDNTAPAISFGIAEGTLTNQSLIVIPVKITEANDVHSIIKVNGVDVLRTGAKEFDFEASLLLEGENQVQVESTDIAGNVSVSEILKINRDTIPPVLTITSPTPNQILQDIQFTLSGSFSEPVSKLKINNKDIVLSSDKKSFSIQYLTQYEGTQEILFYAEDLAGNILEKSMSIEIHSPLLVPELISLTQVEDQVLIHGAQQASRPGLTIKASEGFLSFNTDESVVNPDGSFSLKLTPFQSATVSVEDPRVNQTSSFVVQFSGITRLSGIIRDINDVAIPNVTVSLSGTTFQTLSNGQGAFSFELNISGDQTLNFDGSTAPTSFTGPNRYFSKSSMSINLGYAQQNILNRPIYLTPTLLDGTQTQVVANQSANVSSSHAPGVALVVPSNASVFPSGSGQGSINIMTIPSDKVTVPVPASAVPNAVVSLEPSGLKFNQRVELTLPNSYELKPNTDMVIFSMNSAKGAWEIDGIAKVSSDGQKIKTLPNQGISHFSIVYAVPLMPTLTGLVDGNLNAVDSSKDSYETSLQLPSFKIGDESFSPQLKYKSNWANPTAFVSNYIEIPEKTITYSKSSASQTSSYSSVYVGKTCDIFRCYSRYADFYTNTFYNSSVNLLSSYVPNGIKSQFFISSIKSSDIATGNISSDLSKVTTEIFDDGERKGLVSQIANFSDLSQFSALPMRNMVSYAVELKDPSTNKYLESGLYPSLARYQIQLKNLTIKTVQDSVTNKGRFDSSYIPVDQRNIQQNTTTTKTTLETQVLNDFLPKDVTANVVVQNKVDSESGRGWKINGYQQILNPAARNIVIEEADGSVSTYEMSNIISTVYQPNNPSIKLDQALDFSQWPKIVTSYVSGNGKSYLGEVDLSQTQPSSILGLFEINSAAGSIGNQGTYICIESNYTGSFSTTRHSYLFQPQLSNLRRASNGRWIASDSRSHRVIEIGSTPKDVAGKKASIEEVLSLNFGIERIDANLDGVNQTCQSVFGVGCGTPAVEQANLSCTLALPSECPPGVICKPSPPKKFIASTGDGYLSTYEGDDIQGLATSGPNGIGLNSPQGIALDSLNNIYIADFGNNRVRKIDAQTSTISTVAGNGQNFNFPENPGLGTNVSIYHPKQLLINSQNELFISTEKGLILKLKVNGQIERVAGLPVEEGGVFANQTNALVMALNNPNGMAIDESKNYLYVADTGYHRVVRIDLTNKQADVIAGNGSCSLQVSGDGSAATNASLCSPTAVHLDSDKNLIVQESGRNAIRKILLTEDNLNQEITFIANNKDQSRLIKKLDGTWVRKLRDGSEVKFNNSGFQSSVTDRLGRITNFEYNLDDRISKITFFSGQVINYSYSGNLLTEISDSSGKKTQFSYTNAKLVAVHLPDGTEKSFGYDEKGLMLFEQNQLGQKTQVEYSENNRVLGVKLADNTVLGSSDAVSKSLVSGSNDRALLNGVGINNNQSNSNIIDGNGGSTVLVPDINGYTSMISNAMGAQTTINRDFEGLPLGIQRPTGHSTQYTYDPITKDVLTVSEYYNLDTDPILKKYSYNSYGQVLTETHSVRSLPDQVTTKEYSSSGQLIKVTSPDGSKVEFSYDSNGFQRTKTIYPSIGSSGLTTTYIRNQNGWPTKIIFSDNKEINFIYDLSGNVVEKSENIGSNQEAVSKFEYDLFNRLKKVTSPKNEVTIYSYDDVGNLVSILDPKNRLATYEYNSRNQMVKKTDAFGAVTEMNYDGNNNVIYMKDPNGSVRTMAYNLVNDLLQVNMPDDVFRYIYDIPGESPVAISNKNSNISFFRNLKGQNLYESISGSGDLSSYPEFYISSEYNKRDLLFEQQTSVGNLTYSYDELNRPSNLNAFSRNYGFSYDSASRLVEISRGVLKSSYSYQSQMLDKITHSRSGVSLSETAFSYDSRNYPVQKRTLASVTDFGYDSNGQLVQASGGQTETYSYDNLRNRLSDSSRTYEYDVTGQRLNQDSFFTYQYDNNGNLINKISRDGLKKSHHYQYSSLNQLVKVQIMSGSIGSLATIQEISYAYDVLGRRMQKTVKNFANSSAYARRYAYNGSNVIAEYDGNNDLLAKYSHSPLSADDILDAEITDQGVLAGLSAQAGVFHYLKDHLNSVTEVADANGSVIQKYEYSSFGEINNIKNANDVVVEFSQAPLRTSFTYTGREYEAETGLLYYRARYYDPSNGRFLQQDTDPGSLRNPASVINKYTYADNRPILLNDPSGKFPLLAAVVVAGVVGGIFGGYNASRNGMSFWSGFASGAAIGILSVGATWAGAAALTSAVGAMGYAVGGGSALGIISGAVGGAIGNMALYGGVFGARGTSLFIAGLAGALSGGIAGAYGSNYGQSGGIVAPANQAASIEAVDSFNRTITPIDITNDPTSFINDLFRQNPDGSWTNGAPSMDGPPVYRH
ncbi:MAG: hypothetical protein B7Y39_12445 [Bdellovibrio sp. 28-41-41]|nr:MAG: hypothetical protein B7Y39_12445 [Bdellovibrio sp. 28-41-41]